MLALSCVKVVPAAGLLDKAGALCWEHKNAHVREEMLNAASSIALCVPLEQLPYQRLILQPVSNHAGPGYPSVGTAARAAVPESKLHRGTKSNHQRST